MNVADWNGFDWLLVGIFLFSMIRAYITGLVCALAGLFGFFAGFGAASWGYISLGDRILSKGWITTEFMARMLAYLLIVTVVVAAFEVFGRVLRKSLRAIGVGSVDRLMGAVFGLVRGALMGLALLMAAAVITPLPQIVAQSALRPYLFTVMHEVSFLIPGYVQQRVL
jgi:membrane protein required for colicin V production